MKYMGSKNRHSKDILSIILQDRKNIDQLFVEPFVGGANILDKVSGKRLAADIDKDLICLWKAVSAGWLPPKHFNEEDYYRIKKEPSSPLRGYAAFALSYGGKKFGGWRRDSQNKRNYVDEAYRNAIKQFPKLRNVEFRLCNYFELEIPSGSIIYCDPPYAGTTKYTSAFDHTKFWEWCRNMAQMNKIYVSEYSAPDDFVCVWEKQVCSSLTANTGGKTNVERLYTIDN